MNNQELNTDFGPAMNPAMVIPDRHRSGLMDQFIIQPASSSPDLMEAENYIFFEEADIGNSCNINNNHYNIIFENDLGNGDVNTYFNNNNNIVAEGDLFEHTLDLEESINLNSQLQQFPSNLTCTQDITTLLNTIETPATSPGLCGNDAEQSVCLQNFEFEEMETSPIMHKDALISDFKFNFNVPEPTLTKTAEMEETDTVSAYEATEVPVERKKRVFPKLQLKVDAIPNQNSQNNVPNTPAVLEDILGLELEGISVQSVVTIQPVFVKEEEVQMPIIDKEEEPVILKEKPKSRKRKYGGSSSTADDYPLSVQSNVSYDEDWCPPSVSSTCSNASKRKRGRPAKPIRDIMDPKELAHLTPDKKKYKQLRFKNNEASRRSRQNRKMKDQELVDESNILEKENKSLKEQIEFKKTLEAQLLEAFKMLF